MAKNTFRKKEEAPKPKEKESPKKTIKVKKEAKSFSLKPSKRVKTILGIIFLFIGLYIILSMISYFFTWKEDQDLVFRFSWDLMKDTDVIASNILGKLGAWIAHFFFYKFAGIISIVIPFFIIQIGINLLSKQKIFKLFKYLTIYLTLIVFVALILSFLLPNSSFPWGGAFGKYTDLWLNSFIGKLGAGLLYLFGLIASLLFLFNIDISNLFNLFETKEQSNAFEDDFEPIELKKATTTAELADVEQPPFEMVTDQNGFEVVTKSASIEPPLPIVEEVVKQKPINTFKKVEEPSGVDLEVEQVKEEKQITNDEVHSFDPTLELSNFKFPSLALLEDHGESNIEINREELSRNKDQIIETLRNYKIEISKIKATVGPTVTLYEIVPAPGVRISKIKNLEDDIALNLAALGIRIIAPIPGKGTIGIEVPNRHKNIVSMKSMLASEKFVNSKADLPIAVGKTISNENYIADELLKTAQCRNIKEYNTKFKARKLNPEKGHRFLPYIVLVIDEFADLIMTAGKEVETPIARLAQLARAIGIHLIIATQRPSVNIITGIIKANFPARIAFRVMSKIDSRTILDIGGADQLIGRGDLILSIGSDAVRLQCPFVDTPEVDEITEHILGQQSFASAFILPEFDTENAKGLDEGEEVDSHFSDAARMVVENNSGSTSMLQRRLKLGYNRAGRIMDQLERAGIVGPARGSKPREVFFLDIVELEQYLESIL